VRNRWTVFKEATVDRDRKLETLDLNRMDVRGHAGYYRAGMNQLANVTIKGNAGVGVAENIMSGRMHVEGYASQSAPRSRGSGGQPISMSAPGRVQVSDLPIKGMPR